MRVAITGGTGFVGRHFARALVRNGHEVVIVARGSDRRDLDIRQEPGITYLKGNVSDLQSLCAAFTGCDAVAHLGGINRELGRQTYRQVHVEGTENVVRAAQLQYVGKVILLSFLRARPNCGSPYDESKWAAEEAVRHSGLDFTILKPGVIYGKGDHLLDHISRALCTFPIFLLVGFKPTPARPLAIEDLVKVMQASLTRDDLANRTIAVTGPEEITLHEIARRIGTVIQRRPLIFPVPIFVHRIMAFVFERTMATPLAAKAQVRILSESLVEPTNAPDPLPQDLIPRTPFSLDQIGRGVPEPEPFGFQDCLHASRRALNT